MIGSETTIAAMPKFEKTARAYMLRIAFEDRFLSPCELHGRRRGLRRGKACDDRLNNQ